MKTEEKYKDKLFKLKKEKRKVCKSISSGSYGKESNNRKMKKIKEGFKAERRAIKRGEKNLVKKEIETQKIKSLKKIKDIFPFNFYN